MKGATIVLTSALFLLNAACTTIKPVYADAQAGYVKHIEVGDRVRITYLDSRVKEIRVTEVTSSEIRGTLRKNTLQQPKGAVVVADLRDIHAVETVKVSALKTAGAGVGVIIAIPVIAVGALAAACAQSGCS